MSSPAMQLSRRTSVDVDHGDSAAVREKLDAEIDQVLAQSSSTSTGAAHYPSAASDEPFLTREEEAALLKEVGMDEQRPPAPGQARSAHGARDPNRLIIPAVIMIRE